MNKCPTPAVAAAGSASLPKFYAEEYILPQAIYTAEQSVIGGLILSNDQFASITQIVESNDFYNRQHKAIFGAMKSLHDACEPFDLTTLPAHLQSTGLSQDSEDEIIAYLGELAHQTPSAANILHYANIVKAEANKRALLKLLNDCNTELLQKNDLKDAAHNLFNGLESLQQRFWTGQPRLKAVDIKEFLSLNLPERELILSPWLPKAGLAMIHARPGIGKTHLNFGVAYAVASGAEFLGWKAPKPRGVLLIDGEMPAPAAQERWARVVLMNGEKEPSARLSFLTPDLQEMSMPDLGTKEGQTEVNKLITDDIELIIVDNLSCLVRTGKENDSESWQPIQSWALSLRARGKSVLFIHHQGKTGSQRGSSKKEDVLDTVISLKRPDDYISPQGARFVVSYEKFRGFHGDDSKPFEAHLTKDVNGKDCWLVKDIEQSNYDKVVTLLNEGMSQKDIAEELKINKSNVSRYTKRANEEGLLEGGKK